jgi:hypothetical protein
MSKLKHVGSVFGSWAGAIISLLVLAGAFLATADREAGAFSLLVVVYAAAAAGFLLPVVLRELDDRETLSVYREMTARRAR